MIRLYSRRRAEQAIERETPFIRETAKKYGVPVSWIKGILLQEMTELNLMDPLADLAVQFYYFRYHLLGHVLKSKGAFLGKNDSSTGWGQVYAFCAIDSLNFAADRGIARYEDFAVNRLKSQGIEYIIQRVGNSNINIFFGKKQCLDAIRIIVDKPLVRLSPEHDFIIGALLGYDICCQCERFCERKQREQKEYA